MKARTLFAFTVLATSGALSYVACSSDPVVNPGPNDSAADSGPAVETGTDATPAVTVSCETYCDLVTTHCKGDIADAGTASSRFVSKQACLNACSVTPNGSLDDVSGDTVGCRQYHAGVASGSPTLHCPHAGLSGVEICSAALDGGEIPGRCETLCSRTMALCGSRAVSPFPSLQACHQACKNFEPDAALSNSGDTFGCREYHLTLAYASDGPDASATAEVHCPHIGVDSGPCR